MMNDKQNKSNLNLGVMNGDVPSEYYSNNPCRIGYNYIRFCVNGDVLPCCIAKHEIANVQDTDWLDIWHSSAYEHFRNKMKHIHEDKFFLEDPEWTFCQQCSHLPINMNLNNLVDHNKKGTKQDES